MLDRARAMLLSSDLKRRVLGGAFWSFTGVACAKLLILVSGIITANILGKEQYGELGIVRSTINMFISIGMVGLGATAAKYIAQYKNTDKAYAGRIGALTTFFAVAAGLLITSAVLLFSDVIATKTLNAPYLVNDIRIGALLLFVTVMDSAQNGILSGFENFRAIAVNTFLASVAEGGLMILGACLYGVFGALLGFGLGYVVLYICNYISIRSSSRAHQMVMHWKSIRWKDASLLYRFSLPVALSSFLIMPAYWIVRTLIVKFCGFGELGIYEAADQWRVIILFIPGSLCGILLPILTNVLEEGSKKTYWKLIWFNLGMNAAITLVLSVIVLCFGGQLMALNGKDFANSTIVAVLAFSAVFSSMAFVVGNSITSRDLVWTGFYFNLLWAFLFIGLTYMFLKKGVGTVGAAWALLLAYVVHTVLQLIYLKLKK